MTAGEKVAPRRDWVPVARAMYEGHRIAVGSDLHVMEMAVAEVMELRTQRDALEESHAQEHQDRVQAQVSEERWRSRCETLEAREKVLREKVLAYLQADESFRAHGGTRDERYWALNDIRQMAREDLDALLSPGEPQS